MSPIEINNNPKNERGRKYLIIYSIFITIISFVTIFFGSPIHIFILAVIIIFSATSLKIFALRDKIDISSTKLFFAVIIPFIINLLILLGSSLTIIPIVSNDFQKEFNKSEVINTLLAKADITDLLFDDNKLTNDRLINEYIFSHSSFSSLGDNYHQIYNLIEDLSFIPDISKDYITQLIIYDPKSKKNKVIENISSKDWTSTILTKYATQLMNKTLTTDYPVEMADKISWKYMDDEEYLNFYRSIYTNYIDELVVGFNTSVVEVKVREAKIAILIDEINAKMAEIAQQRKQLDADYIAYNKEFDDTYAASNICFDDFNYFVKYQARCEYLVDRLGALNREYQSKKDNYQSNIDSFAERQSEYAQKIHRYKEEESTYETQVEMYSSLIAYYKYLRLKGSDNEYGRYINNNDMIAVKWIGDDYNVIDTIAHEYLHSYVNYKNYNIDRPSPFWEETIISAVVNEKLEENTKQKFPVFGYTSQVVLMKRIMRNSTIDEVWSHLLSDDRETFNKFIDSKTKEGFSSKFDSRLLGIIAGAEDPETVWLEIQTELKTNN